MFKWVEIINIPSEINYPKTVKFKSSGEGTRYVAVSIYCSENIKHIIKDRMNNLKMFARKPIIWFIAESKK